METWPSEFQTLINEDSFGITFGDTTVRSDVDSGLAKVRSRFTQGIDIYTCTIFIDYSLWDVLKDFYRVTLGNGTRTFGFDDPMTGESAEFRFKEPPSISPRGGRNFVVSMSWEKIP